MADQTMNVLPAPKFCGRGIKYKTLTPDEKDQALERAARMMQVHSGGPKVDLSDFAAEKRWQTALLREYAKAMLVAVTEERGFKSVDDLIAAQGAGPKKATWRKVDAQVLDTDPKWGFKAIFSGRDEEMLIAIYNRSQGYSQAEIDDIVGKGLPVSED